MDSVSSSVPKPKPKPKPNSNSSKNNSEEDSFIGVMDLSGNIMKNYKKLKSIDIYRSCSNEQEYEFLLDSSSIDILDDIRYENENNKNKKLIKVKAKFSFDNKDKTSELLGKLNSDLYDNLSKNKMRLSLDFSGELDLVCQRCSEKMHVFIDSASDNNINNIYSLISVSSLKDNLSGNNSLELRDLMDIFCLKGRLDLISLIKQEVALCVDMFPKHDNCIIT